MTKLRKPPRVAADPYRSAKWDEICAGRDFSQADAPVVATLCQWYKVLDAAIDEMDAMGGQTTYTNRLEDVKALPQIATMKTASAEIRQLGKQLGLAGDGEGERDVGQEQPGTVLQLVSRRRAERVAGA